MKAKRKAIFLPSAIYQLVVKAAKKNDRTLVAEIKVRFGKV